MDNINFHHALRDSQNRMKIMEEVELTKTLEIAGNTIKKMQKAMSGSMDELQEQLEEARKVLATGDYDIVKIHPKLGNDLRDFRTHMKNGMADIHKDLSRNKTQNAKEKSIKRAEEAIDRAEIMIKDTINVFLPMEITLLEALMALKEAESVVMK